MKKFLRANAAPILLLVSVFLGLLLTNISHRHFLPLGIFRYGIDLDLGPTHVGIGLDTLVGTFGIAAFFFLVGLELKRELRGGNLSPARNLIAPFLAALLGVALPAIWYVCLNWGTPGISGWPIPTATDVTFALAVFVLFGSALPKAARTFLLSFAVIDDVIAVLVIAVVFQGSHANSPFGLAPVVGSTCLFVAASRLRPAERFKFSVTVLSALSWLSAVFFTGLAGVEPALMGLVLAFAVRRERIHAIEAKLNALVSYVALPLFGLYASSVVLPEASILNSAVFWGVVVRPVWKFLGVFLGGWVGMHFASEKMKLRTVDLAKVAVLGGIGFTVSLLVANIAFGAGRNSADQAGAVVGTFIASAISMVAGALVLSSGHRSEATHGS